MESLRQILVRMGFLEPTGVPPANGLGAVAVKRQREVVGTGFTDLNKVLGGLQPSTLVTLAGSDGMGATVLALNIARAVAGQRRPDGLRRVVAVFAPEFSNEQLMEGLLAMESGISTSRLGLGNWTDSEEISIMAAAERVAEFQIFHLTDSGVLDEFAQDVERLSDTVGLDLIVIDSLQLLRNPDRADHDQLASGIADFCRSLKILARRLEVPVLALTRLPNSEAFRYREPQFSDLRDGSGAEDYSDSLIFLHRYDMYFSEEEWERRNPGRDYPRGIVDLIIAKHRNGPLGRVQLVFKEKTATFMDLFRGDSPRSRLV